MTRALVLIAAGFAYGAHCGYQAPRRRDAKPLAFDATQGPSLAECVAAADHVPSGDTLADQFHSWMRGRS